ncbi:MAG: hypothetical protein WAX63_11185, partial [Rhodoferax sp.]
GIKVVLAQTQQRDVRFEDIAVGDTSPDGKGAIEQGFEFGGLEILANQSQTGVRTKVVGELFDNEVGHDLVHLLGEQHFTSKPLIYMNKSYFFAMKSRIQVFETKK